jgi:hypothetical protein
LLPPEAEAAAGVLVVHGLLGDPEAGCDLLPGPALGPGVLHLEGLQDLDQAAQGRDRSQPDSGSWLLVAAATWVTSLGAASPMASNYIDFSLASITVDFYRLDGW